VTAGRSGSGEIKERKEIMKNRERAVEIADNAIGQIENSPRSLDTSELMAYALVLVLADISENLENIQESIYAIHVDGIGIDNA